MMPAIESVERAIPTRTDLMATLDGGHLYTIQFQVAVYDYPGKHKPTQRLENLVLSVNDEAEAILIVWEKYKKYLKSHTKITEYDDEFGEPQSKSVLDPEMAISLELCGPKFIRFKDKVQKRDCFLNQLTVDHLSLWCKGKTGDIEIRLYPYGSDLNINDYREIQAKSQKEHTDRAGATKEEQNNSSTAAFEGEARKHLDCLGYMLAHVGD